MEGKTKPLGLDRQKCPCLFAYRAGGGVKTDGKWSLEMHVGTHVDAKWEQTGLERSTCDRVTQDGFQKQVEAETSKASLQKTDLSVLISFCSLMKMRSTILTASSLTELRQHPTGGDDDDAVRRQTVGITSNLSLSDGKASTTAFIMFREISCVAPYVKRNRRQKPNEAYVLCALLCD